MQDAVLNREFASRGEQIYLNHAGVSPWPARAAAAVKRFADENAAFGPLHYERWIAVEARLRDRLRTLINAPSCDDIAMLKNTSEALSVVAHGLPWQAGDNVVSSDQEFPSNRIVWESLHAEGVELRQAAIGRCEDPEAALFALCDHNTRVLALSSVQYASGLRMDLGRIGEFCRRKDIVFCVDGIQSVGALQLDVQAAGIDALAADGHKWMLGPEGVALFYVRPALRDRLRLHQYGWHMVEAVGDYERRDWRIARSARRFECGSPNLLGSHALEASIDLLLELGPGWIERRILGNTRRLIELIDGQPGLALLGRREDPRLSGIVTFAGQGIEGQRLCQALRQRGVHAAARGGGVRFSPHCYTSEADLERAVGIAASLAKGAT